MTDDDVRTLATLETAIEIVELIQEMEGARLADLHEETGIPKSTLHYHVRTLEEHGYLVKEGVEFHVGMKFLVHGQYARSRKRAYQLAGETVHDLANRINEDVDFSIEEHGNLMVLHHVVGNTAESGFQLGQTYDFTSTAAGKAILSEYPRSRVEEIVDDQGFTQYTENTITDRQAFFEELERSRERGYTLNQEEWVEGLYAVSSPVKYPDGEVVGALSVWAPSFRFDIDVLEDDISRPLLNAVSDLEEQIESSR